MMPNRLPILLLLGALCAEGQTVYTYVGELGPDHVPLAWGTTKGENTIGRSSKAIGAV